MIRPPKIDRVPGREGYYFANKNDKWYLVEVVEKNGRLRGHMLRQDHWFNDFSKYVWSERIATPIMGE